MTPRIAELFEIYRAALAEFESARARVYPAAELYLDEQLDIIELGNVVANAKRCEMEMVMAERAYRHPKESES